MRFDVCADSYDEYARAQQVFARRVARFAQVTAPAAILELGAGTGALTEALCQFQDVTLVAADISAAMMEVGRQRAPGASWIFIDAFREPIPGADLQISSGLLQWAEDPVSVLEKWRKGVRGGGRMIHAFPCEPCLHEWRKLIPESPLRWRTQEEWLEVFRGAALQVKRKEVWTEVCHFDSAITMLRSLHRSGVTGAPQVSTGRLRRALREYENLYRTANGVFASWTWMAVEAT